MFREAAGVPERSPVVTVEGVEVAVAREGSGVPVVCLHAIGHGGRDFEAFAATMKDRFEIIRVDWPGHGRSGLDRKPASAGRYAEVLEAALTALDIKNPILVGCSIGGTVALRYAARNPVRALVLCNSGGLYEVTPGVARACRVFARFFAAGARGAWWFGPLFAAYYRFLVLPMPRASAQRRRIVRAGYETAPFMKEVWQSFSDPESDTRSVAAALDVPIWCAWAMKDRLVTLRSARDAIAKMKRATVTGFNAGHAAFLEQPDRFARDFALFATAL